MVMSYGLLLVLHIREVQYSTFLEKIIQKQVIGTTGIRTRISALTNEPFPIYMVSK